MKRALIIDDEPLARMVVLEYLQDFKENRGNAANAMMVLRD